MELSPGAFGDFLNFIGQDVMWRAAYACPCVDKHSGAAKPACPICGSKGHVWAAEVACRIGVTAQDSKKALAQFGVWEPGQVLLTIGSDSPMYAINQWDRIRLLNANTPFSQVLTKGVDDRLLGTVLSFSRVFWLNTGGDAIIEGSLPTSVASDGTLGWASGAPPDQTQYSVTGVRYDEYYTFLDTSQDRNHHHGAALPRKYAARRFDLFGR